MCSWQIVRRDGLDNNRLLCNNEVPQYHPHNPPMRSVAADHPVGGRPFSQSLTRDRSYGRGTQQDEDCNIGLAKIAVISPKPKEGTCFVVERILRKYSQLDPRTIVSCREYGQPDKGTKPQPRRMRQSTSESGSCIQIGHVGEQRMGITDSFDYAIFGAIGIPPFLMEIDN